MGRKLSAERRIREMAFNHKADVRYADRRSFLEMVREAMGKAHRQIGLDHRRSSGMMTLLLPRVALLAIVQRDMPEQDAMRAYGVSEDMLRMRLDRTGVNIQMRWRTA
jgi:hypothetical protein